MVIRTLKKEDLSALAGLYQQFWNEHYGDFRSFVVIENMIVDAGSRRSGVGKALLAALELHAKVRNCTQMILVTEKDWMDARSFYETYGFQKNTTGYKKKL